MTINIGNECTQCRKDTSFGSGRFVNRIPSGTDELEGYMCEDCQNMGEPNPDEEATAISVSPQEEFNPFDPPQHWLSDYPKPPRYEEGSDRGATDEH